VGNLETYNYDNRDDNVPLNPLVPRDDVPEDAGYRFEGWYDNQGFTGNPVTVVPGGRTGDFTLYAKWNPCSEEGTEWDETAQECVEKVYHIEYVMNGGQLPDGENNRESFTWSERNRQEELHSPVKTGSVFGGWYDNPEFNGDTPVTVVPNGHTEDFTLYAKWVDGVMALFDCNNPDPDDNNRTTQFPRYDLAVGDSVVSPDSEECGILVGELVAWDCTDNRKYSLNGSDTITVTVPGDGIICTADIDLSEVDFNINYRACDSNGNEVEIPEEMSNDWPKTFKPAHPITFPTDPSFEEYKFNGWYSACSGGSRVPGTTRADTRDVTVYAHLQRKPACSEGQYLNASLRCINCPDEYPYADAGIESRNDCYRLCDASEGYTANRERIYYYERNNRNIRCELVPNDYSITYMEGDEIKATDNYTYGTEVTLINYSKTGYVFNGWCDGAETCDTILGANSKQTGWIDDKVLYAQLTPKDYPIVYMDGNQAITTFDDVYYSYKITDNVSLKDTYIKAGYVFHGWKDADNNSITGWEAGEAPADANGTVTVYADLEAIDYHVNYYCDAADANAVISDDATFGDSYVYRTKTDGEDKCNSSFDAGYTFDKWTCGYGDNTFDVDGNRVSSWNIASDVNCYAAQKASPYNITYFDGTLEFAGLSPDKYTVVENITLPRLADYPDILVKTGYKFIGWKDAEDTDVVGW
ncbi:MAG: InlB B-repeat-containing protein, partial [Alphaproteobacteria bacterium]|nr:InlB B-repeat-containing protein [Alphaproteobacteria bacterium]